MSDAELNFKACIESLERFNSEYIQPNKIVLESRSPIQVQSSTSSVSSSGSTSATSATPIVVNDYVRMCRTYCIMLWTYWEALKISSISLEELRLIRNCLVHHEGDIAKYSQDPKYGSGGTSLLALTNGKSYVQGYSLVIADSDLVDFTTLVKTEFTTSTGVLF